MQNGVEIPIIVDDSLRALLIQKDAKLRAPRNYRKACLRALLIQKDAKPSLTHPKRSRV